MALSANRLLTRSGIGGTPDGSLPRRIVKTISVQNAEIFQRDIAPPKIQSRYPPVIRMIATPGISRKRPAQYRLLPVLPLENKVIFFNKYFFMIDPLADEDHPRGRSIVR